MFKTGHGSEIQKDYIDNQLGFEARSSTNCNLANNKGKLICYQY